VLYKYFIDIDIDISISVTFNLTGTSFCVPSCWQARHPIACKTLHSLILQCFDGADWVKERASRL